MKYTILCLLALTPHIVHGQTTPTLEKFTPYVAGWEETECRQVSSSSDGQLKYTYFDTPECRALVGERELHVRVTNPSEAPSCRLLVNGIEPSTEARVRTDAPVIWISGSMSFSQFGGTYIPKYPVTLNGVLQWHDDLIEISNGGSDDCAIEITLDGKISNGLIRAHRSMSMGSAGAVADVPAPQNNPPLLLKMVMRDDERELMSTSGKFVGPTMQLGLRVSTDATAEGRSNNNMQWFWGPHRVDVWADSTLQDGRWDVAENMNVEGIEIVATPSDPDVALTLTSGSVVSSGAPGGPVRLPSIFDKSFSMDAERYGSLPPGEYQSNVTLEITMP